MKCFVRFLLLLTATVVKKISVSCEMERNHQRYNSTD